MRNTWDRTNIIFVCIQPSQDCVARFPGWTRVTSDIHTQLYTCIIVNSCDSTCNKPPSVLTCNCVISVSIFADVVHQNTSNICHAQPAVHRRFLIRYSKPHSGPFVDLRPSCMCSCSECNNMCQSLVAFKCCFMADTTHAYTGRQTSLADRRFIDGQLRFLIQIL